MYGGHITDFWDRMVDNTYLKVIVIPSILKDGEMMPETGFKSPRPKGMSYQDYLSYLDTGLPSESPKLYGLHLNAEIAYLNSATRCMCARERA